MMFKAVEDRETPKAVYNAKVYTIAMIIASGAALFGYDASFIGTTITQKSFLNDFGLSTLSAGALANTSANIVSVFQAGCFFGAAFGFPIMERFGRKIALQIATIVFIIGAIVQTTATTHLGSIYAGRVLVGLGVGTITAVAPVYLAEMSPPAIRGRLVGFYEIAYQLAAIVGFWINYGIKAHQNLNLSKAWRIPMAVQLIPSGLLLIGTLFLIETPRYLMKAGKDVKAVENLAWVRNLDRNHPYVMDELAAMRHQIELELSVVRGHSGNAMVSYVRGIWAEISAKGIRNRMFLGFMIMMFQNMVGTNAINYYSPTIFKSIGVTNVTLYTGIYGLVKAGASVVFLFWLVDVWGRRPPLIWCSLVCAVCMFYMGGYIKIAHPATQTVLSKSTIEGGKAATAAIFLFAVFFCISWSGLAWIICSEIYPLRIRGFCAAYTAMCQWIFQFIIARTTPNMVQSFNTWGMFILFGSFCVAGSIFAFLFIPELKGKTLEQMDEVFGYAPENHTLTKSRSDSSLREEKGKSSQTEDV